MRILFLALLVLFHGALWNLMDSYTVYDRFGSYLWETDAFRSMELGKHIVKSPGLDCEELALLMLEHDFNLKKVRGFGQISLRFPTGRPTEFRKLSQAYHTIFDDLKYFPVPKSSLAGWKDITYENGWMVPRSYGGDRGHEGCDLMAGEEPPGYYPVVSVTAGIVEKVGWLEKGGWRIGIRSPSGAYFYYAHLDRYEKQWKEGDPVTAGEVLGYIGDSGYGPEGTTGQFAAHLHLGIYLKTDHYEELSVNPYWILKYLENFRLEYRY